MKCSKKCYLRHFEFYFGQSFTHPLPLGLGLGNEKVILAEVILKENMKKRKRKG
jgi:hypothetical protein